MAATRVDETGLRWTRVCVGDIVLMHVDPDIVRPLLVVSMQGRRVSGVLTVDPNLDNGTGFVSQRWFYKPDVNAHTKFICEVEPGSGVGQYITRDEYTKGRG